MSTIRFSKKNKFLIISLLILSNVVIRIPIISHEMGVDSFYLHSLATTISIFGHAKWLIHPASISGLYPFSYPSAMPIALSGISQTFNIDIEHSILLFDIILSIFMVVLTYILAKIIVCDDIFAFIIAFVYSLSPLFLIFTYWQASSRNIYLAFFPMILFILLKAVKSFKIQYVFLYIIVLIVLFASHRMAFFSIATTLILLGSIIIFIIYKRFKKLNLKNSRIHIFYLLLNILIGLIFIKFGDIDNTLFLGRHYFGAVGPMLPLGIIGFFVILWKENVNIINIFIIINIIISPFIMTIATYGRFMEIIFVCILIGFGFLFLKPKQKIFEVFILIFLISSILFSLYMLNRSLNDEVSERTLNTANFLKYKTDTASIADNGLLSNILSSFSEKLVLPFGGPYLSSQSPELLIYDIYNINQSNITMGSIINIPNNKALFFYDSDIDASNDWITIMERNANDPKIQNLISKYDIQYGVKSSDIGESEYLFWKIRHSSFFTYSMAEENIIFSNGLEKIYSIY